MITLTVKLDKSNNDPESKIYPVVIYQDGKYVDSESLKDILNQVEDTVLVENDTKVKYFKLVSFGTNPVIRGPFKVYGIYGGIVFPNTYTEVDIDNKKFEINGKEMVIRYTSDYELDILLGGNIILTDNLKYIGICGMNDIDIHVRELEFVISAKKLVSKEPDKSPRDINGDYCIIL